MAPNTNSDFIFSDDMRTSSSPSSDDGYSSGTGGTYDLWQNSGGRIGADDGHVADEQLFFVSTYTDFEKLAHGPRGSESKKSLYVYRFNPSDGSMLLLNVTGDKHDVVNPAFSRFHPRLNVVYTCTEDIENNGQIIAYAISPDGTLKKISQADAGGTSTCYLTIDRCQKHMLAVNYWDSTLSVIPLSPTTGEFTGPIVNMYDPKRGSKMNAATKSSGGCNHSNNDDSTIRERQKDPHSHALVLDPFVGCVAYVPDLGKDLVREFFYDAEAGAIMEELNALPSGLATGKPDGPRYLSFHPSFDIAYVVNELSSSIAVFSVNKELLKDIARAKKNKQPLDQFKGRSTLALLQSIGTIPKAFPTTMNTCGRVCVHQSGQFVIVSNRGHESIAIFRVHAKGSKKGQLTRVGFFHTRGETPRHFQFDSSGQYLVVANQDSNSIAVFNFNLCTGEIKYSGNEYRVPSPNFVCCCSLYDNDDDFANDNNDQRVPLVSSCDDYLSSSSEKEGGQFELKKPAATAATTVETPSLPITMSAGSRHLEAELENAKREIMELKRQLSSFTTSTVH